MILQRHARRLAVCFVVVASAVVAPSFAAEAQDAQPCEPRRELPTAENPPEDRTTILLTTTRAVLGPAITEREVTLTRFGPSEGAVGVFIDIIDLSAHAGEHYVDADQWVRWDDGEVGVKTVPITIIDHDPAGPERVFVVAMNVAEPPSVDFFEYDDQIDVYIPGVCGEATPETTVAPTSTLEPTTTAPPPPPAPGDVATDLPETGNRSGLIALVSVVFVLLGAALVVATRRNPRSAS